MSSNYEEERIKRVQVSQMNPNLRPTTSHRRRPFRTNQIHPFCVVFVLELLFISVKLMRLLTLRAAISI
jgi:hypothetical protein